VPQSGSGIKICPPFYTNLCDAGLPQDTTTGRGNARGVSVLSALSWHFCCTSEPRVYTYATSGSIHCDCVQLHAKHCQYCKIIQGPRNGFQLFLLPVYYLKTVEQPETDHQVSCNLGALTFAQSALHAHTSLPSPTRVRVNPRVLHADCDAQMTRVIKASGVCTTTSGSVGHGDTLVLHADDGIRLSKEAVYNHGSGVEVHSGPACACVCVRGYKMDVVTVHAFVCETELCRYVSVV
jgi:hypothetical protein